MLRPGDCSRDAKHRKSRPRWCQIGAPIVRHIKPLLGRLSVAAVTRDDVDGFMHAVAEGKTATKTKTAKKGGLARVRGGRGTASRTVGLLGSIFSYAVRHRMRPDNPVHGVTRFADGKRERRVSDDEYKALGDALRKGEAESIWPASLAATRFLALTGWRTGEALALRWDEIDLVRRCDARRHQNRPLYSPVVSCCL
jgi:integrase